MTDDRTQHRIAVENLTLAYGTTRVLDALTLPIERGKVTVLAGPNGCGKSTLLRAIRRLLRGSAGQVLLDDVDIARMSGKDLALQIGLLAQSPSAPGDMSVEELVRLGRYPHQTMMQPWSPRDAEAVERAMVGTGVTGLRTRPISSLSGGQLQRVWIALVLAQETDVICLDEPVNHLDIAHQLECLDLVKRLNREHGRTIVLVLHDLNLAARYADQLVFVREGRIAARGTPAELMSARLIEDVFGVHATIITDPVHGSPVCIPASRTAVSSGADEKVAEAV